MPEQADANETATGENPLELENVSSRWNSTSESTEGSFTLNGVTLHLSPGSLTGIIGPVGSGKSSLLLTITREMELTEGEVRCGGSIGYYSQTPWLFNGTHFSHPN